MPASPDRKAPNPNCIAIPRKPEVTTRAAQSKKLWGRVSKYSTQAAGRDKRLGQERIGRRSCQDLSICTAGNRVGSWTGGLSLRVIR